MYIYIHSTFTYDWLVDLLRAFLVCKDFRNDTSPFSETPLPLTLHLFTSWIQALTKALARSPTHFRRIISFRISETCLLSKCRVKISQLK